MSMKEKALLIKEDFDQLYDAGKQSVISNSKYIEKQASGKVIRLDDVSEVAHKVKVKADTPTEVKVYGKNLFDGQLEIGSIDSTTGNNLTISTSTRSINYIPIIPNTTYTISREITGKNIRTRFYDKNKTYIGYGFSAVNTPMTFTAKEDYAFLRLELVGGTVDEKVQVEIGSATEYEPYKGQTITATPTGTEIPSMCPTMTFLADSDVTVDYFGSYGRQAQYDAMCDAFQNFGTRKVFTNGFCYAAWTEETIPIKYDMYPTDLKYAFQGMNTMLNFEKVINDRGIKFNTSNCTAFNYAFASSGVTHVPTLDLTKGTTLDAIFGWNSNLVSVRKVILKDDGSQQLKYFAQGCSNLEEIRFEGTVGQDINLQWSKKLTLESALSLLWCLKDFNGADDAFTKTITLSAEVWELLQTEEAMAELGGHTGNSFVEDKGWNAA